MLLKDLLLDVCNEIDGVEIHDVVLGINSFLILHPVDKEVVFRPHPLTPSQEGGENVDCFAVLAMTPHPLTPSQEGELWLAMTGVIYE